METSSSGRSKKKDVQDEEENPIKRFDLVLPTTDQAQIVKWNVKEGSDVFEGQDLCGYAVVGASSSSSRGPLQFLRSPFPFEGVIRELHPEKTPVAPGTTVAIVEYCAHEMVFADLCAICGKTISNATDKEATISLIPSQPALTVSRAVAERDAERTAERLMASKKLSLVLDLDQTLVHATQDPAVESLFGPGQVQTTEDITCAEPPAPLTANQQQDTPTRNLYRFGLAQNQHKFYLKLRPHLQEFLTGIKDLFELHIYTMGSRAYARKVAQIIDPEQKLFRENIVSRDECGSMNSKNLQRIFPVDDSMVLIVDDRVDVWQTSKNLLKIEPYFFFNDARVNALPRDRTDVPAHPHPHRHPVRQSLRRSSIGNNSAVQQQDTPASSASPSTSKRKRDDDDDDDDEAEESPLPPPHSRSSSTTAATTVEKDAADETLDGDQASLPSGRTLLSTNVDSATSGPTSIELPAEQPIRRKIDTSNMPSFKKRKKDAEEKSSDNVTIPPNTTTSTQPSPSGLTTGESTSRERELDTSAVMGNPSGSSQESSTAPASSEEHATMSTANSEVDSSTSPTPTALQPYRDIALRDEYLVHMLRNLREAHRLFYAGGTKEADETQVIQWGRSKRDTKYCLHVLRNRVLAGVHLCFSSIFPSSIAHPESTPLWRLAEEFGGRCHRALDPDVTHLIGLKEGTDKVKTARARGGVHIVHLEWLLESMRRWQQPDPQLYALPAELPPGLPEGLRPYDDQIRWLEICYVRDLDKVLNAHRQPEEEDEEAEVSDAEQDDFLKWALKGDGEEEENSNDEEEDEEEEDEVSSSKGARTKAKTSSTKQRAINSTSSGLDDEEWNELEKELELSAEDQGQGDEDVNRSMDDEGQENASGSLIENYEVGGVADLDRFERLAELERLEEEESQAPRGRGPGGSKLNKIFSASKKYGKHRGRSRSDDDEEEYDELVHELEDELFGEEQEDDDGERDDDDSADDDGMSFE